MAVVREGTVGKGWIDMFFLLILLAIIAILAFAASIASSAATYNQAQAVVETARVAQTANTTITVLVATLAVVVVLAAMVVGYMVWRDRKRENLVREIQAAQLPGGKWAAGPNARFQRAGQFPALPAGQDINRALTTMMMLQVLNQMQNPPKNGQQSQDQDWW